jgi:hypothetical protein
LDLHPVFIRKKTATQKLRRPHPEGFALFAEIMAFEKKGQKPSSDNLTPRPTVERQVGLTTAEIKQPHSEANIQPLKGATIYYEKNGEKAEAHYTSRTLTVAKARILINSGFSVHVIDSEGRRFFPEEFNELLKFEDQRAVLDSSLASTETKIDGVLAVLNNVLAETASPKDLRAVLVTSVASTEAKIDDVLAVLNSILTETAFASGR